MTTTYHIEGMTCQGCLSKVQSALESVAGDGNVLVDLDSGTVRIHATHPVDVKDLELALSPYPKYQIRLAEDLPYVPHSSSPGSEERTWFQKYRPILTLFFYITALSTIVGFGGGTFDLMQAMRVFMAGFFLAFSFFKMLDLKGFAESYAMYDIIAKRVPSWGYIYAGIEFLLGLSFAANFQPILTLWVTLIVMSVSIIGVLQSVLNRKRIQCACLGVVFDLPMSTVTIIEDALMIGMSAWMLVQMG